MFSSSFFRALFVCALGLGLPATHFLSAQSGGADAGAGSFVKSGLTGKSFEGSIYQGGAGAGDDSEVAIEAALPAELLRFGGEAVDRAVLITWETVHESQVGAFVVEQAADGVDFRPVGHHAPLGGHAAYSVSVPRPAGTGAYYRLRVVELDGSEWYSGVDHVHFAGQEWAFRLLKNPVVDGRPEIASSGLKAGESFTVRITDPAGRTVHTGRYRATGGTETLSLPVRLLPSTYFVTVIRQDGHRRSRKVLVSR